MTLSSSWRVVQRRVWQSILAVGVVLAVPRATFADILVSATPTATFAPNPGDMYDLDHHYAFTWKIPTVNLGGGTLTGATLTFQDMYNWDGNANALYIHLLDTSRTLAAATFTGTPVAFSGNVPLSQLGNDYGSRTVGNSVVSWYADETSSTVGTGLGAGGLYDDFTQTRYHSDPNWLVASGTADDLLDMQSFPALGNNPATQDPGPYAGFTALPSSGSLTSGTWYYKQQGTSGTSLLYDYTYVFSASDLASLAAFIGPTGVGDIALGFDPDCHFFNAGIALNLYESFGTTSTAVPEPASILLLGTGLALAARLRVRRKKTSAK